MSGRSIQIGNYPAAPGIASSKATRKVSDAMIDFIMTPACRAAFPDDARALHALDADHPMFDDLSEDDHAELRALFAERRRQRAGATAGERPAEAAA